MVSYFTADIETLENYGGVLILFVMDNGLVRVAVTKQGREFIVLILFVMDNGLVLIEGKKYAVSLPES